MSGGSGAETMRAFVALNLDVMAVRALAELSRSVREHTRLPEGRWVAATKLHLTLKFLGPTDVGVAPALVEELGLLVTRLDTKGPLRAALGPLSAFPSPEAARVLVSLIDDEPGQLGAIAAAVESRLAGLGFAREPRTYRPHVTLARYDQPFDAGSCLASETPSIHVSFTELVLYRSDLARSGAEYTALGRWPLA